MNDYDYESQAIDDIYFEIREGSYQSLEDELLRVRDIFFRSKDRENLHILFTRLVILGGCVLILLVLVFAIRWDRKR
ncbi:MAG: hypothetical protein ACXADY_04605 [Candidatus Hodarchaeales archaeon]